MNAKIRLREFAPVVIEKLTANRLIPELLSVYTVEYPEQGKFFARNITVAEYDPNGREHLCAMEPADFERLIADYFLRRDKT